MDAARLFYRTLWRIVELARGPSSVLLVQGPTPVSARCTYFLTDLCRASDIVLRLGGQHPFTLEHKGRLALLHLAAVYYANPDPAEALFLSMLIENWKQIDAMQERLEELEGQVKSLKDSNGESAA